MEYSDLRNRILAETPQSSYSCFQEFLANDRIDFFFLGDFNEVEIQNVLESFGFKGREVDEDSIANLIPISCKKAWFGKMWDSLFWN